MNTLEEKWRANKEKVAFARLFPGMLRDRADAGDRDVVKEIRVDPETGLVATIYADGYFVVEAMDREPGHAELLKALHGIRAQLEPFHRDAYAKLDELSAADRELTRRARKENILGAIRNNIAAIPELYEEIPKLLEELRAGAAPSCSSDDATGD
jgi:hypothetical protein